MWGRIYPHVVLLIFANTIFKVSCKGNGSLTFLIDDTLSMADDIKQVLKSVDKITNIVKNETSSLIDNMVLVTFNDPGVHDRVVTRDPTEFKKALGLIKVHNEAKISELDCWEPSMKGLLQALNKSKNDSYIFVFTDAPAKDYIDSRYVIEMCQKKQTQIVFVLTGTLCRWSHYVPEARGVYFDIAVACSGLAIFVKKNEVEKVFGPIEEIIKGNKTVITTAIVQAGISKNIPFAIDDHTDYVIVSASGTDVTLKINEPSVSVKEIMSTDNAIVLKLSNTKPGNYVATVKGKTNTSVVIVGRTDFFFTHGFSELKPKSLSDTSLQPKSDAKGYLSVSVTDDNHSVRIEAAKILDMDGKPIINKLPLTEISKDFYITDPFVAPSQRFKVAVQGIVKATNKPIIRTAKIPVTPPPPKIAPKVQGVDVMKVKKGETAVFECKVVRGFPPPKITWQFWGESDSKYTSLGGSESVLRITNVNYKHGGKYKCVADNGAGKDEHVTTLFVPDLPKIVSSDSNIYTSTEGNVLLRIPCITAGLPKPSITWKLNGLVIDPSAKYSIENGTLIIRDPKVSDTNSYTCEAKNELGAVSVTFRTSISQAPQVSGVTDKKVRLGTPATIECTVVRGFPPPKITWQFWGESDSKFTLLAGSEGVLRITNVKSKHEGMYKCVADNGAGKDEHVTTLFVQDMPKIISSDSNIHNSTEGDALLRIPCVAIGLPKPSITWKFNGLVIDPSAKYFIENGTLIIRDPKVSDTNSYTCEAKNEVGAVSVTFRTSISQAPQVSGVTDKKVRLGTPATIECTVVRGFPPPKITWQFWGESDSKFTPLAGSEGVLRITNVKSKHEGMYKCVADNGAGKDEHVTTLFVQDMPRIISSGSNIYNSTEGDALLRIPCVAAGLPKPSITWKLNGLVIDPSTKYSIENGTLIIRDPKVSDTNSYTCEAKNEVGAVSVTFRTSISQAPQVSGVTDKKVRLGTPATIECTVVRGFPPPKITWQFWGESDSKFTPLAGSEGVLRITNVKSKHEGMYKCVADNGAGKDEHVTTLFVQDMPKIISSDSNIHNSTEGDALLRIPCVAIGLPKPSITWKFNGLVIDPSAKYFIENGTLIIRDPKVSDTNSYTCEAKNEVGAVSVTFRTSISQAPQVSGVTDKKVRLGTPATIECTVVRGFPPPKITWQFWGESDSKFTPLAGSEGVLRITNVKSKHEGMYKCVADNGAGKDEHVTTLFVQDMPRIISSGSNIYNSTEGDALLRIPCVAAGLPKPSITWKLNGLVIDPSTKYSIENGTLIIRDPKVSDTNSYTCEAKNEVGAVSVTFRTSISQAPQVSGVTDKKVRLGTPATIECTVVRGFPPPKITWQFWGESDSKFTPLAGSEGVLRITNVKSKHEGMYKCVADNGAGKDEHVTTLFVQDMPKIISSDSNIHNSTEGDALLRIPCVAIGLPKPSITWKFNGLVIDPSAKYFIENGTLIIRDPKVSDTNSYTCEAKNEVGAVSVTFRTSISQAPQVSGVTDKKVRLGTPATIECTVVRGFPPPKITWQFWGESDSKFTPLAGSEGVLRITNVKSKHEGMYKCVADNGAGKDEHVTTLFVQDMPRIISSGSNIYNSTEGDALLRIPCVAAGLPKPSITWKLNGLVIDPSAKYFIENGTLIIRDPKVSDTNSYTCEAKNEVGAVSVTFRTSISQAPQVSGVTDKKVRLGTPATIECTVVRGFPPPKITWQFWGESDSKFTPLAGSEGVLRITNVKSKHEGMYKCVADNGAGKDEHVTTLFVQDMPRIISSGSNIHNSTEGDALLRIPCVAVGLPKPSINWKLNGLVIDPSAKYSIENGTLIIRDPKVSDTNSYTCEAKNEVGAISVTFRTSISQAPQVSGVTDKKVRLGTPATIECTVVRGFPPPKITWQFWGESDSKFTPLAGSEGVLRITNVKSKHEGMYKCVADNGAGKVEHVTTLFVQDMPRIISSGSNIHNSTEGDALLRIPCVAAGLPKPSINWKLNGLVIDPSAKYSIENGTLIIRDPKVSDTNSYTCEAKNEVGAVSVTFRTSISQAPQVSGITDKKVRLGTPAGYYRVHFWGESDSKFTPLAGSESVLRITNVKNKHEGMYKCLADNGAGKDEHVTRLFVQDMPKIISSDSNIYNSTEGDALLRIPCVAAGLPKPSITWKLNGLVIDPSTKYSIENGTLIIRDPKVSDTNSYTCEAKNEVGAVSVTFRTSISQAPQVSGVSNKKVRIGTPATIECNVVRGFPPPKITWQFWGESDSKFTPLSGSESVLRITNVKSKHEGMYKCVADNGAGKDEHVTTLFVQDMPKIISSGSNIYNSTEGDALLRIPCVAVGLPKPSITWKLNGLVIDPSAKYSIENGTLIIRDPKVSDTNSYTCEAKNEVGAVSVTFRTSISQAPQVSGVTDKKVRLGTPATIECTVVKGEPKPKITWKFMANSDSEFMLIPGSYKVLNISKEVENKHAGRYKCIAKNTIGSDEHVTTLIVESLPGITTKSTTVEGIEGDLALRIPCDVVGIPQPEVTWKINGTKITPDRKYSIMDGGLVIVKPEKNDSSWYTCEAKNDVGSVSTMFQAVIKKNPRTFGTKHYVYLLQGETRKLKCEAYSSESQSVKWFEAKAKQKQKDSSLSTTTPLPELESSETTTSSSQDYYSSAISRTFTLNEAIKDPYIQIVNASDLNDGSYTCRVSDKHGNTHTHTYVVDVGSAPEFLADANLALSDWNGVISDITQNCDIQANLKPKSVVEWTFNGEVFTDFNLAGVGQYTCTVSNVHGSVQKKFNVTSSVCLITNNFKDAQYMPLVLNDKGFWHKLKTTNRYTVVEQEEKITLSCPSQKETSNTFKNFSKKNTLEAFCYKEDSFVVEDKIYKLSDLQCTNSIQPSVIRNKVKCSTETSELLRVGYNVSGFLEVYEVCFDTEKNMPLYTRIIMTDTDNNGPSAGYNWYTYPGIGYEKTEKGFSCKDTISSCCYSKSQLVNAIDFNDGPAKRSTFIDPLNVIPVWLPCDSSKPTWETVNDNVKAMLPTYNEIVTWSGTHTFQEINGVIIPRYLWKLVWYNDEDVIAIVHVNDPSPTEKDIKCKDICTAYSDWIEFNDKYTYCCSQSDFFGAFDIHFDIGETLDAALEKMKRKSD